MPIYMPKTKKKVKCKSCGKEFTITVGGYGDAPKTPEEYHNLFRDLKTFENLRCPKCNSDDTEIIE